MGNKINPELLRINNTKNWYSKWYNKRFNNLITEDEIIRKKINLKINKKYLFKIIIEHFSNLKVINIITNKPGIIIGKKGNNINKLKLIINNKNTFINIINVNNKERVIKRLLNKLTELLFNKKNIKNIITIFNKIITKKYKIKGTKILISGRIKGNNIAKREHYCHGSMPLNKIKNNILFFEESFKTKQGMMGIKLWINEGYIK